MSLELRTIEGDEVNALCCRSPMDLTASIDASGLYDIEVILISNWGKPEREAFEMTASLQQARLENAKP
jgi:hypothetical protein